MDYYQLIATTSLTIQLTVLALLIVGFTLQRQKKFRQHGLILFSAVVLHAILVFVIMIPSFGVIALTETGLSSLTVSFNRNRIILFDCFNHNDSCYVWNGCFGPWYLAGGFVAF